MSVQLNLFGVWSLFCEWGRIGCAGRVVTAAFLSETEATQALTHQTTAKLRCGYSECFRRA